MAAQAKEPKEPLIKSHVVALLGPNADECLSWQIRGVAGRSRSYDAKEHGEAGAVLGLSVQNERRDGGFSGGLLSLVTERVPREGG